MKLARAGPLHIKLHIIPLNITKTCLILKLRSFQNDVRAIRTALILMLEARSMTGPIIQHDGEFEVNKKTSLPLSGVMGGCSKMNTSFLPRFYLALPSIIHGPWIRIDFKGMWLLQETRLLYTWRN